MFLLACFASLAFFVILLEIVDRRRLLAHVANHEGHGEVVEAVAPRDLHDGVQRDQVITGVEDSDVAFPTADIDKLDDISR